MARLRVRPARRNGCGESLQTLFWPEGYAGYPDFIHDYARSPDAAIARLSPTDALRLATALQAAGRSYRSKVYEGGSHDLLADFADVREEMDRWLDRYVRDRRPGPRNGVTQHSPGETGVK